MGSHPYPGIRMYSQVNDCGPIYGKVFRYDIHAVTPITFTWPVNDFDDEYYTIYRDEDVVDRHQDRIKIKKSITYESFFEIIDRMTPHIVFIFSKFKRCVALPKREPNKNVTTLIYGGSDMDLEQMNQWFPALKYLYVYKLKKMTIAPVTMEKLHTLSCWYCDMDLFNTLNLPNLENLDVYRFSGNDSLSMDKFNRLDTVRIDARYIGAVLDQRLRLLQYFRVGSDIVTDVDRLYDHIIKSHALDIIVPPGLVKDQIKSLHDRLHDSEDLLKLGVYVDDLNILEYTKYFENLQIFDHLQPLKVASIRDAAPLHLHLPKQIDRNIMTNLRHLNGGIEQHHKFLLSNFNIFTDSNASAWINLYNSERYVYVCALEVVLDDVHKWPTVVKTTKNRVFVINAQRTDVYMDVNAKPMFAIAEFLRKIYTWVKFRNVHLVTRGDDRTQNENYAGALQAELADVANIQVFKYSKPATIIVA